MDHERGLLPPTIDTVFASNADIEICSYLAPRDLVSLSRTNRQLLADIRTNLFHIVDLQQQRWSRDDDPSVEAESVVIISKKHSYISRDELADSLLKKIEVANLRYDPPGNMTTTDTTLPGRMATTDTLTESLHLAQTDLKDESRWLDGEWYGTFKSDPREIWKPLQKFSVGCRFGKALERGRSRRCFIDFMLRELGTSHQGDSKANGVERDWARYMIAHNGIVGREWQWKIDGEETVGFMIRTPTGQELEIKLTKKTRPKLEPATLPIRPSLLSAFGF